jgi:hypothetical protein
MPVKITQPAAADDVYASPFRGPINHTAQIAVNITALTNAEIDAKGWVKPGLPLSAAGTLVGAAVPVFGVVIEPIKVAASNSAGDIAAASAAFQLSVAVIGAVSRPVVESNLGRVLNANEIAGFGLAGCLIKLLA